MLHAELSTSIASPWSQMDALKVGGVRRGPADLFVTIANQAQPLLRVDVYRSRQPECMAFQDAILWNERVFVGYGESVHIIDPAMRTGSQIVLSGLASYFEAFYAGREYLLVASGESLLRLADDGGLLWAAHHLGLDGVVVDSVESGVIRGQGEWDPPGGWKPYALRLDSGQPLHER
jgi:hypothetical protein